MRSIAPLIVAAATACSAPPPASEARPDGSRPPPEAPSAHPSTSGGYDVHEWGLVRADQGDKVRIGAVAPPIPPEVFIITKPVLYFRADEAMTIKRVSVLAPAGAVVETWPLAATQPEEQVAWTDVSIDPKSACKSSPLPRKTDLPCSKLPPGDECESLGLFAVRTVDSSCVRVGDKTESFLFYRVSTTALTPPLRFSKKGETGEVVVENDGDEPIPGLLLRIETVRAETRTLTVTPPAPHRSIVVGRDFAPAKPVSQDPEDAPPPGASVPRVVTGPGREGLRATIRGLGLADTEADAFMKAWDESLFGSPSRGGFRPVNEGTSFLYFLPVATLERAAKVSFDPPPRSFKRAFAVWTHLASKGAAR